MSKPRDLPESGAKTMKLLVKETIVGRSPFIVSGEVCQWVNAVDGRSSNIVSISIVNNPEDPGEWLGIIFHWS